MIYTCTMTPSIDYTIHLPTFKPGELNRTEHVHYYPGGKGINVSRVLHRLGISTTALGFAGGFTGEFIQQALTVEGIQTDFIATNEITRINVKIKAEKESELNGPGPIISKQQQRALLTKIEQFQKNDWFLLAGSLPETIDSSFYEAIAATCNRKGVHLVIDTSGKALHQLLQTEPFLIKPNQTELEALFNTKLHTTEQVIDRAKQIMPTGIKHVMVSMGEKGAILVNEDTTLVAESPQGNVINTVGAGDSMVAGFLASYLINQESQEAFRYAVAAGSATAFSHDLCDKSHIEHLIDRVSITQV
ncbi:1-phosphofructokinase [Virgibacillus salexigens]|uniref:1-phosphofructokinase n=1 Tax=Virgibacillus salexigens TaxID=61016 RepID=UPI003081646E